METKVNFNVLESIETVYKFSQDSHLRKPLFECVAEDISNICSYTGCSEREAVLFANSFIIWFDNGQFSEVFKYLGLKEYEILKYRKEIDNLCSRHLLEAKTSRRRNTNDSYDVPQFVVNAVTGNEPLKLPEQTKARPETLVDILEEFDKMSNEFDAENIYAHEFYSWIDQTCGAKIHRPFFREIKNYQLSNFETYFLLDTVWDAISNGDNDYNTSVRSTVSDYYSHKSEAMIQINAVVKNKTKLTKSNLIELSSENFGNKAYARLSDHIINFLAEHEQIFIDGVSDGNGNLLHYEKIPEKTLYYNPAEREEMAMLHELLEEENLKQVQHRLCEKNMPMGIAVLLHGVPGTGKTESVYQLARKTGRNILKVDISEAKSMWFGESQKIVKKIFIDYQKIKKAEKQCPILLFNEADAIISKRKEVGSSNVAETENAIQNIILEEMENFDGILFATTNLVENMDSAFERRFLFKVKFDTPDTASAAKIWQTKLPGLKMQDCKALAENFRFSGGEMENIARKCVMTELLEGIKPDLKMIEKFCENEKWAANDNQRTVGFR